MIRELPDGYELDDDPRRIDVDVVHRYCPRSPTGRAACACRGGGIDRGLAEGRRLLPRGELIGFARVVTDKATFAMLADVFVLPGHRGRGLGVELVREAVRRRPYSALGWWLTTADAQAFYRSWASANRAQRRRCSANGAPLRVRAARLPDPMSDPGFPPRTASYEADPEQVGRVLLLYSAGSTQA